MHHLQSSIATRLFITPASRQQGSSLCSITDRSEWAAPQTCMRLATAARCRLQFAQHSPKAVRSGTNLPRCAAIFALQLDASFLHIQSLSDPACVSQVLKRVASGAQGKQPKQQTVCGRLCIPGLLLFSRDGQGALLSVQQRSARGDPQCAGSGRRLRCQDHLGLSGGGEYYKPSKCNPCVCSRCYHARVLQMRKLNNLRCIAACGKEVQCCAGDSKGSPGCRGRAYLGHQQHHCARSEPAGRWWRQVGPTIQAGSSP